MLFALFPPALAEDLTWTCVTPVCPLDAHPFAHPGSLGTSTTAVDLRNEALAWVDKTCIVDCGSKGDVTCRESACLTSAGAWVESYEYHSSYHPTSWSYEVVEIEVIPSASEALPWTDLRVYYELQSSSEASYGGGRLTWTAWWDGSFRKDWPDDTAIAGFRTWDHWLGTESLEHQEEGWDDGACTWTASHAFDTYADPYTETWEDVLPGGTVDVEKIGCLEDGADASIDGVSFGRVDHDTWQPLDGDCPHTEDTGERRDTGDTGGDTAATVESGTEPASGGPAQTLVGQVDHARACGCTAGSSRARPLLSALAGLPLGLVR